MQVVRGLFARRPFNAPHTCVHTLHTRTVYTMQLLALGEAFRRILRTTQGEGVLTMEKRYFLTERAVDQWVSRTIPDLHKSAAVRWGCCPCAPSRTPHLMATLAFLLPAPAPRTPRPRRSGQTVLPVFPLRCPLFVCPRGVLSLL
jgi:hypothetical protein